MGRIDSAIFEDLACAQKVSLIDNFKELSDILLGVADYDYSRIEALLSVMSARLDEYSQKKVTQEIVTRDDEWDDFLEAEGRWDDDQWAHYGMQY